MDGILQVTDLHKHFDSIQVLTDLSLSVPRGEVTALIGSNGAGKSTLLNIVSGFIPPDAGQIVFDGQDITRLSPHLRARAGLARTFQHPRSFRSLSVEESVVLGSTPPTEEGLVRNLWAIVRRDRDVEQAALSRAHRALETCGLDRQRSSLASDLTYGEQKLLMLAQVFAQDGELLCFDELCAGLDETLVAHVADLFRRLGERGKTVLFIEHNLQLVRELADRVVFLHQGAVYREGPASEVLEDPEVVELYLGQ